MSAPTNNCATSQVPTGKSVKPPTHKELIHMETAANIAESYLTLLDDILTPPDGINDPDPGLERFNKDSRFAMGFMIGEICTALRHYETLIEYSYHTIKQNRCMEVES